MRSYRELDGRELTPEEEGRSRENSRRWDAAAAQARETGRYVFHEPHTIFAPSGESFGMVFTYKSEFKGMAAEMVQLANEALDARAAAAPAEAQR